MRYVVGIDIGGTATKLGLFTEHGELVRKLEIPTDTSDHGARILKAATEAAEGCIQDVLEEGDAVLGIGIGIPGAVSDGHTVKECINIGWSNEVDVEEQMRRYTEYPVTAINDADAAALGEYWKGSAAGHESAVFVTIGTGVGAGIISHGRLIVGALGYGGEIGHITVNPFETRVCSCGKRGCLELYASASGIVHEAEKALESWSKESVLTPLRGRMTAKDIFDAARDGDDFALSRVDEFGRWMGIGLGSAAQTVDPEVFVIGGGVSRAGEILLDAIKRHYPDWVYGSLKKGRFVMATLGNDAGIYGAAKLMLDKVSSQKESHAGAAGHVGPDSLRDEAVSVFEEDDAVRCFVPRKRCSHKGDYGYVALAGGSFRYSGAVRLAAMGQSAVSAGAGVAMLATPRSLCYAIRPEILESTLYPISDANGEMVFVHGEWDELMKRCSAIAVGMGMGDTVETRRIVMYLLERYEGRLLIDADGLNALASSGSAGMKVLRNTSCDVVLTPHPGEMARLCDCSVTDVLGDPAEVARTFAGETGAVVLLKGAQTVVSDGSSTYLVDKGCAGMATGGSGDVLSGIATAMLGYWDPERVTLCNLAASAAWTAGMAGELAQEESCDIAMKASDTARHVGDAVTILRRRHDL